MRDNDIVAGLALANQIQDILNDYTKVPTIRHSSHGPDDVNAQDGLFLSDDDMGSLEDGPHQSQSTHLGSHKSATYPQLCELSDYSNDEDSDHTLPESTSQRSIIHSSSKKKVPTHDAREPTQAIKKYCISRYNIYDPTTTHPPPTTSTKFKSFAQFDDFTLYINPALTSLTSVPKHGVQLDDMTIHFVLRAYFTKQLKKSELHQYWPADFDKAGMIRATRYPLGNPAKVYVPEGSVDGKGVQIGLGEEGWFYAWDGNIHVLCGEEGAEGYLVRPSFEKLERGLRLGRIGGIRFRGLFLGVLMVVMEGLMGFRCMVDMVCRHI